MLEQGGYGKSASQIRNFGIRIGSEGWAGRAGVRSGAGPAPRLEERPSRRPGFRLVVAAGKRARRALVVAVPSRGRWRRGVPSRAAYGVRGSGGAGEWRCAAAALDVRRAPLAHLHIYAALWALGLVSPSRPGRTGVHSGRGLGRRLAADSELVRTRGIRLFN